MNLRKMDKYMSDEFYNNNNNNNNNNNILPRQIEGRGMADIRVTRLHDEQVKPLQTYFLNKQASSPLHAAAVKADDRLTPLDLHHAHEKELATDEEYNNRSKHNGPKKPYTADTRTN
jgi:hypothetical protein